MTAPGGGPDGLRETLDSDPASFLALVAAARVGPRRPTACCTAR